MARIQTSTFAARKGATLTCSKCRRNIEKGERYRWYKPGFRSRYKVVICSNCKVKPSETMSSKMAGVVAAVEDANEALDALEAGDPEQDTSSIESILQEAASTIEGVADEYREAAEASPTGLIFGEDYNERADEISNAASDLEGWTADENEPPDNHDDHNTDEDAEPVDKDDCEDCADDRREWWSDQISAARDALSEAESI